MNKQDDIALKIEDLSKTFGKDRPDPILALKEINLCLEKGEFLVVIGDNGSGKSTLLNCIAGSTMPDNGKIFVNQHEITFTPEYKRSKMIGRVFQDPTSGTASDLSISDNYRLAELRGKKHKFLLGKNKAFHQRLEERLQILEMGLETKTAAICSGLSGGQRQALSLLMATASDTSLLLLDEPTAALDPKSAEIVMKNAEQIIKNQKLTALMVTHNLQHAVDYGDRIIFMRHGEIMHDVKKNKNETLSISALRAFFEQ